MQTGHQILLLGWQKTTLSMHNTLPLFGSSCLLQCRPPFVADGNTLHCLADSRLSSEATWAYWFLTAAFRISSSVFFHDSPYMKIRIECQHLEKKMLAPLVRVRVTVL